MSLKVPCYCHTDMHAHTDADTDRLWKLSGLFISRILGWPSDTGLIVMF